MESERGWKYVWTNSRPWSAGRIWGDNTCGLDLELLVGACKFSASFEGCYYYCLRPPKVRSGVSLGVGFGILGWLVQI